MPRGSSVVMNFLSHFADCRSHKFCSSKYTFIRMDFALMLSEFELRAVKGLYRVFDRVRLMAQA